MTTTEISANLKFCVGHGKRTVKMIWRLLLILFSCGISNSSLAQMGRIRCAEVHRDLKSREAWGILQVAAQHRLGIGVYAEVVNGDFVLGISPYSGALHQIVVNRLRQAVPLKKILWMGELRYDSDGRIPQIIEANETSGFYHEISQARWQVLPDYRSISIENDVRNLPDVLLKKYFAGKRFEIAGDARLARELRNVKGDIRHGIGNSIQLVRSLAKALHRPVFTMEQKIEFLYGVISRPTGDVALVRWMIADLLHERRVRFSEVDVALEFLTLLTEPNLSRGHLQALMAKNPAVIQEQLMIVSRFNEGHEELLPFEMWHIRE